MAVNGAEENIRKEEDSLVLEFVKGDESAFYELYNYWWLESKYGENKPTTSERVDPQLSLEWIHGNATFLHQELIQWSEYHTPAW